MSTLLDRVRKRATENRKCAAFTAPEAVNHLSKSDSEISHETSPKANHTQLQSTPLPIGTLWQQASPDRFAWPHSSAATVVELDTLQSREQHFRRLGYDGPKAATLATKLLHRDRDLDDRRMCPECQHYDGQVCLSRRTVPVWAKQIGPDLTGQLRRCADFRLADDIEEVPITWH